MTTWNETYGPWAIVTGASEGIGREFAQEIAARGASVVLVARREDRLRELADELRERHGVEARVHAADLASPAAVDELARSTADLDVGLLVAAAGFGTSGPFLEADLATELDMVDVNCRAVTALAHRFGNDFARRGRGGIVLLSSLVAFQGVPRAAGYAATKAFVQSLAEGLRGELAPLGVDVLAVAPGPVRSGFARRAGMTMGATVSPARVAASALRALGRRSIVRPGWLSKLLEWSLALLPRQGRVWAMSLVMAGMTKRPDALPGGAPTVGASAPGLTGR